MLADVDLSYVFLQKLVLKVIESTRTESNVLMCSSEDRNQVKWLPESLHGYNG